MILKKISYILFSCVRLFAIVELTGCIVDPYGLQPYEFKKYQHTHPQHVLSRFPVNTGGSQNENWECNTEVEDRSGELENFGRCKNSELKWACYEEITETCEEENTHRTKSLKQKIFTGRCGDLSDCF